MLLTEHMHSYADTGGEGRRETERGKKTGRGKGCERKEGEQITAGRKDGGNGKGQKREWGENMKKGGGGGGLQNPLLSHKCMCEHLRVHTRTFAHTARAYEGAHTISTPGEQFHKQAYV